MREINNKNREIGKFQKTKLKAEKVEKTELSFCGEAEETSIKDFSNPTESLGRSQVSNVDGLKEDVSFGMAHPKVIEKADALFNLALAKLQSEGHPKAYELASSIATSEVAKSLFSR